MGTLAKEIGSRLAKELGPRWLQKQETAVDSLWDSIEMMLAQIDFPRAKVRIYQDGLPVCGRETEIVHELANAGSRNHCLIAELAKKGATIMGTESGELLIEEYRRVKQILAQSGVAAKTDPMIDAGAALLQKRDRFMAEQIDRTLQPGEIGILSGCCIRFSAISPRTSPSSRPIHCRTRRVRWEARSAKLYAASPEKVYGGCPYW